MDSFTHSLLGAPGLQGAFRTRAHVVGTFVKPAPLDEFGTNRDEGIPRFRSFALRAQEPTSIGSLQELAAPEVSRRMANSRMAAESAAQGHEAIPFLAMIRDLIEKEQIGAARLLLDFASSQGESPAAYATLQKVLAPARVSTTAVTDVDRSAEYRWLAKHGSAHKGQWIALLGEQLVANAGSLRQLLAKLRGLELARSPLVHHVM